MSLMRNSLVALRRHLRLPPDRHGQGNCVHLPVRGYGSPGRLLHGFPYPQPVKRSVCGRGSFPILYQRSLQNAGSAGRSGRVGTDQQGSYPAFLPDDRHCNAGDSICRARHGSPLQRRSLSDGAIVRHGPEPHHVAFHRIRLPVRPHHGGAEHGGGFRIAHAGLRRFQCYFHPAWPADWIFH